MSHKFIEKDRNAFSQLALKPELISTLNSLKYEVMTPIQAQSLPKILKGDDLIGQARTGTGKTAAFALGLLQKLNVKRFRIQSLVMCPTRELAEQVAKTIRTLARGIHNIKVLTLCGGVPMGPQIGSLEHGAHIIVGTPGRIIDHIDRGYLHLEEVDLLVLDEADRMLEMGFQREIDSIMAVLPHTRQTLLFSATFPMQIQAIAEQFMVQPIKVKVLSEHSDTTIEQHFYECNNSNERFQLLQLLLLDKRPASTVVFCNTKREAKDVAAKLAYAGFSVGALHGDLEQREREQVLLQFTNKSIRVMVATDVAARGLDIDQLEAVINYHLAYDCEVHIHRVGRTGRAGSKGVAYTFYEKQDDYKIKLLEDAIGREIFNGSRPSLEVLEQQPQRASMATIQFDAGKKQKIRPGDLLGALTGEHGIEGAQVGKIHITDYRAYVAVERQVLHKAIKKLSRGQVKGKNYRAWELKTPYS